MKVSPL